MTELLVKLPDEILARVFDFAGGAGAVAAGQVCTRWATLAEQALQRLCTGRGWRMPRRPRGWLGDERNRWRWRTLYLSRACKGCHHDGVFPVLATNGSHQSQVALICRACALDCDYVKQKMKDGHFTVALCSENGEQLLPAARRRKRKRGR